ncbi:MAG: hypothetical protein AAF799_26345 [Myxococcota bacterium]
MVQRLGFVGFIGMAGLGGCEGCELLGGEGGFSCTVDCHEAVESFCEGCEAQGGVPYQCDYVAVDWIVDQDGVVHAENRHLDASACYESAEAAEAACAGYCNSDQWEGGCISYGSYPYDCTGTQDCGSPAPGGGDEVGEPAPAAEPPSPSCDAGWYSLGDVVFDRTVDAYRVNRLFFLHLLADPRVVLCDTAELTFDAAGQLSLTGARPGSLAYEAGLRDGDVPVSLQGLTAADLSQAESLYWELRDVEQIEVVLDRGSRRMEMTYIIE